MPIYPANPAPVLPGVMQSVGLSVPQIVAIDVGCSGGVDSEWMPYLPLMQVYAIDPLVKEIERLRRDAPWPNVQYFDGFVTGPERPALTSPFYLRWFDRTATVAAHTHMAKDYDKTHFNAGQEMVRSENRFSVDEFCARERVARVDFLKSDTDGFDWSVLAGAAGAMKDVLAVHVEATFATEGGGSIFRDIDALMDQSGMFLAGLHPITYTRAALPGRFRHGNMADDTTGATLWGDFFYLRDIVRDGPHELETVLRFAILAEMFNLADVAAEALLTVRSQAPEQITALLDALVCYSGQPDAGSYDELMRLFAQDPRSFAP